MTPEDLLEQYLEIGTPEEINAIIDRYGRGLTLRSSVTKRLDTIHDIPDEELERLARARENGRLYETPVRMGATVYLVLENIVTGKLEIRESRLIRMVWRYNSEPVYSCYIDCPQIGNTLEYMAGDFGKEVFGSYQAALKYVADNSK